ncbi:MAG: LacI family DNA-binding transcriptional regulator [Rhodoluna sp.]
MSVSVRDVARKAGVSVGTVSNVLNNPDKVADKTVSKVQQAIRSLGFVRNDAARQLRAGKSHSIGLLVLDVRNPFFTDLARGAEEAAAEHHMSILLANSDENHEREKQLLSLFEEQRVAGLLVSPVSSDIKDLVSARDRGTPIVLVDRESKDKTLSSVAVDDVAGGFMALSHLIETGRKRIMFAGGPMSIQQIADRLKGSKKAIKSQDNAELEVFATKNLTVLEGRAVGEAILSRPASQRPDAVFAANDLLAIGIMQVLVVAKNISIPGDIALVGYDDISFASSALISLSSVRQPSALIGAQAIELLIEETEAPQNSTRRQVVFQPELVVRDSSRSKQSAKKN